jgi:hypothetical protein
VLFQFSEMRVCALERVVFGANCHDRTDESGSARVGDSERDCGTGRSEHECVCDQPKLVGQHAIRSASFETAAANLPAATAIADLRPTAFRAIQPGASSPPDLFTGLHLPLLI